MRSAGQATMIRKRRLYGGSRREMLLSDLSLPGPAAALGREVENSDSVTDLSNHIYRQSNKVLLG